MSRTSVLQFDPGQGCALRFLLAVAVSVGQTEQQLMIGPVARHLVSCVGNR
jgi:hypothetical protein